MKLERGRPAAGGRTGVAGLTALVCALVVAPGASAIERTERDLPRPQGREAPIAPGAESARRSFRARMGRLGLLTLDRATGTPRAVGRLDGFLTDPTSRNPREVALDYVRARPEIFGLDGGDLSALEPARRYVAGGIEQVRWRQTYLGIPAIDTALTANLTTAGRLVNVGGAPRADLSVPSVEPTVSAARAYRTAASALGGQSEAPRSGPQQKLVIYEGAAGPRLGWRLLVPADSEHVYDAVVDARSGVLARSRNLVSEATGRRYENYPGAPAGGTAGNVDFDPFVDPGANRLFGPSAHTFSDVDDVVRSPGQPPPASGEIAPVEGNWGYPLTNVGACADLPCVWDPGILDSWRVNAAADATQLHWFVSNFHDHLENTPAIGFTNAAGNFEGNDRLLAQSMDGANTAGGVPDPNHVDNANMLTLPDGFSPHMQMYLTRFARSASTGFDAAVVYHEYSHGLIGRTVTDAGGFSALGGAQAGAINEGLSDWYAADYLVAQGLEPDEPSTLDVTLAKYSFGALRSQPTDCRVGMPEAGCPAGALSGPGGYTYGDLGRVFSEPEVHADGEIITQTLWQLRQVLIAKHGQATGTDHVRRLVTSGLRLAPENPSFLDLRNAILQADTAGSLGDSPEVWDVFAERGMGYFASTTSSDDVAPVESFSDVPPAGGPTGTVAGTITEAGSGVAAAGVRAALAGHDSGVGPELSAQVQPDGGYSISNVPVGTYPLLRATGGGFEPGEKRDLAVASGTKTIDFRLRRNLASRLGGAQVASFTGPDYAEFGCGPGGLIDDSQATVWGSSSPTNSGAPGAKQLVVRLSRPAAVASFELDPTAGCGDDETASLGAYELQVSSDGTTFTSVGQGSFTAADNNRFNVVTPASPVPAGTEYVKLIAKGPQSTSGSGAAFMDVTELRVFAAGTASVVEPPEPGPVPDPVLTPTGPGGTIEPPSPIESPLALTALRGSTGPRGARVKITCKPVGVARDKVRCTVTAPRAARRRAKVTLKRAGRIVTSGSVRRADSAGRVRLRPAVVTAGRHRLTIAVKGRRQATLRVRLK